MGTNFCSLLGKAKAGHVYVYILAHAGADFTQDCFLANVAMHEPANVLVPWGVIMISDDDPFVSELNFILHCHYIVCCCCQNDMV